MRKMKRLITLLMTVVMMMAMSITAFAEPSAASVSDTDAKITISNLQVGSTVKIYKVATVVNNKIVKEKWAEGASYDLSQKFENDELLKSYAMDAKAVEAIEDAFENANPAQVGPDYTADQSTLEVPVAAGVYYILATGKATQDDDGNVTEKAMIYKPMVAVAVEPNGNGKYVAKSTTVKAKGTPDDIKKGFQEGKEDTFVKNGQVLDFVITKKVPTNVDKFVVYDYAWNLTDLTITSVTVGNENITKSYGAFTKEKTTYSADDVTYDVYSLNFTNLVYDSENGFLDTYEDEILTIKYTATVTGNEGFKNTGDFSVKDGDEKHTTPPVVGWTGAIKLTKIAQDTKKPINGAEFVLKKVVNNELVTLKFTQLDNGDYLLAPEGTTDADTKLTTAGKENNAELGEIRVTGLDEGTYVFEETKAPAGYSTNVVEEQLTVKVKEDNKLVTVPWTIEDPALVSLPFTGGMGTTIFTILGVAIMAMAAALFFATKKSHN